MRTFVLALLIGAVPISTTHASMIRTESVVADMAMERERIRDFVKREDVQERIIALGVSPSEASARVASLSNTEIATISGHLDSLPAGGEGIYLGLGALVLLAILVILLVRR